MLRRVTQFSDRQVRDIAQSFAHNAFFAHPEHLIIAMLGDENKPVRDIAVGKIMSLHEVLTAGHTDTFKETSCVEVKALRKFKVPSINENTTSYHQLVDLQLKMAECYERPPLYL